MGTQMLSLNCFRRRFVKEVHSYLRVNLDIQNSKNYSGRVPNHDGDPSASLQHTGAIYTNIAPQKTLGTTLTIQIRNLVHLVNH